MIVAVAQLEPQLGRIDVNLNACLGELERAAAAGASLIVLPECALTGYMLCSTAEVSSVAQEIPGPATEALVSSCARFSIYAVVGLVERAGDRLYNTAVLVGPEGILSRRRKAHLPFLGVDRFVAPGDEEFRASETPIGRIGIEICYELRFPEVTRLLALDGADLVAHPTNWAVTAAEIGEFLPRARAAENRVFFLTADRTGSERDTAFLGWSQIIAPSGRRIAEAVRGEESLLFADVDLAEAREKDIIPAPGEYEIHLFGDRRPDLYGRLADRTTRPPVEALR